MTEECLFKIQSAHQLRAHYRRRDEAFQFLTMLVLWVLVVASKATGPVLSPELWTW